MQTSKRLPHRRAAAGTKNRRSSSGPDHPKWAATYSPRPAPRPQCRCNPALHRRSCPRWGRRWVHHKGTVNPRLSFPLPRLARSPSRRRRDPPLGARLRRSKAACRRQSRRKRQFSSLWILSFFSVMSDASSAVMLDHARIVSVISRDPGFQPTAQSRRRDARGARGWPPARSALRLCGKEMQSVTSGHQPL